MNTDNIFQTSLWRLVTIALVLTFGFSVIGSQVFRYQVIDHDQLAEAAERQRDEERKIVPKRGIITDANGYPLALNLTQWDIGVSPSLVAEPRQLAAELGVLLGLPEEELYAKLTAKKEWVSLATNVPQEIGEAIQDMEADGLTCEAHPQRAYPEGSAFAHLLGFVNLAGDGYYGVEGYYNPILAGADGKEKVEKYPVGGDLPFAPEVRDLPRDGSDLILSIDRNIQHIAAEELERALEEYDAQSGTVLIMAPKTGAVLALVNLPSYDPNQFAGIDLSLLADPTVSNMWEPGSIFKIVTWSAGIDAGVINPTTTVYDDGVVEVGGRLIRNWDRQGHGQVSMLDGLTKSLNTVAAYISTTLGKERFYNYLRRFGFGNLTDVDLSSEGPGMMKQPGDPNWFPSELGTNSFGQGIAVTPMQMITAVAAVANRGLMMEPYVVQRYSTIDSVTGEEQWVQVDPEIVRRAISQETAETMTWMLTQVIEQGATKAQVPGYRIAGKTGTAQIPTAYGYHPTDTIASFVGFAPADDPQFIVLIKLDRPTASPWGSQTAAPTFRAIAERLFVYLQIPPDEIRLALRQGAP